MVGSLPHPPHPLPLALVSPQTERGLPTAGPSARDPPPPASPTAPAPHPGCPQQPSPSSREKGDPEGSDTTWLRLRF